MPSVTRWSLRTYIVALLVLVWAGWSLSSLALQQPSSGGKILKPGPKLVTGPVTVVGTLAVVVSPNATFASPASQIELPLTDVSLEDQSTGKTVSKGKTQLNGLFHLRAHGTGTYRVCWSAGGLGSTCGDWFKAPAGTTVLRLVPVAPKAGVIYGKVLTADGRPCWLNDPFFHIDVTTNVSLLDASGVTAVQPDVTANVQGEYAFGSVKTDSRYIVRGQCEKAVGEAAVTLGSVATANVTLPNHAPVIAGIAAYSGGKGITRAESDVVQVEVAVRDADKDSVEYLWRTNGGSTITGPNGPKRDWNLASAGLHTVYLMVRDGKGGYAFKRFDLPAGGTKLIFSGNAIDETTQAPVKGAEVTVNGVAATTNAQGWFSVSVPPASSPERYVLNINHPHYALLSRIFDKEAAGNTFELIRVQRTSHDPTQAIDLVDSSSSGPCGGQKGQGTVAGTLHGGAAVLTHGEKTPPQKPCRFRGAHLVLPAGSLVDADQNQPSGSIAASVATLNPSRRALPGDYRAVDAANQPAEMLSFGAVYAEFRDSSGKALNLKHGATAEVRVPVSDEQLPSAKPSISVWSYETREGLWLEEGKATLQNTADGWMYVGTTKHFSTLNMDVAGNDPAQATCVRFSLGASLAGWTNLVLRAYVSYAGTSVQVKETALDNAQIHAIYRIPYAPPAPPPNTLRIELRGTYNGVQVVLLNNIIPTDLPRPKMTGNNLWPPYPYAECGDTIVLEADPVNLPYYGDIDATGRPAFLTGPHGEFLPANGEQAATDYYNTLDPGDATNPTLSAWWTNHGFDGTTGSGGTEAGYLNNNDLGFGRDMNCKKTGSDLACFVTNYGLPDQNPANADAAVNHDPTKRAATVAMEYKASEPADKRVRFYVYGGGNPATAGKLKFADLDGLGPKPVPFLCLVCHGGSYDGGAKNAVQARFREFDLPSFKYSGNRAWDFAPSPLSTNLNATELTNFGTLNQLIRDVAPGTSPIAPLVNAWYPGAFNVAPVKPAVPSGWNAAQSTYHNVFAKSCRTCHIARDDGVANNYYTFDTAANYATTRFAVCGSPKVMPNAFVTYKNFWSDTPRVIDYATFVGGGTCQ